MEKWSAPFYGSTAKTIFFTGLGASALLYANRTKMGDPLKEEWSKSKPMGGLAHFGDTMGQLVPNLIYIGATHFMRDSGRNRERRNLMFDTTLYTGLTVLALKHLVGEERPSGGDTLSFPSGHTATAFAFAGVIGIEHEWYWAVPAYAMATVVGASRINDNAHWLHDVVFGATLGISYAYGLNALRDRELPGSVTAMPLQGGGMLQYSYKY